MMHPSWYVRRQLLRSRVEGVVVECPVTNNIGVCCAQPVTCTVGIETFFEDGKAYTDLDVRQHQASCGHIYDVVELWDALYAAVAQAVKDGED